MQYIVIDCETTGLSPLSGDRICEIGGVKIEDDRIVDSYWRLVNPERGISYSAYMVNKITLDMVKDAPKMDEVLPSFLEFIGKSKLAAYNAGFDISFLNAEFSRYRYPPIPEKRIVDIYILAKKILPHLGFYPLWNVARELGVSATQTHRALADAKMAAQVFIQLVKRGGREVLDSVHLDYTYIVSMLKEAIKKKERIKIKFLTPEGERLEKIVFPFRIESSSGEEFLEYKSGEKILTLPIRIIEEVV